MGAKRFDLSLQRLHPALKAELRRGVCGTELKAGKSRTGRDRDNLPRTLLAHDRKDRTGYVHRPDEACRELPFHLLRGQLLKVACIKAGGIVDEHVDCSEPINGSVYGSFCIYPLCYIPFYNQPRLSRNKCLGHLGGI